VHVIITAGGSMPRELAPHSDQSVKALLSVGALTLLDCAVQAVRNSSEAGGIAVIGNDHVLRQLPAEAAHIESGQSVAENIHRGFLHHGGDLSGEFLVLSPDLPFITGAALDEFIRAARPAGEFVFPLVSADSFLADFPGASNKFERVDGRPVTLGSCFYVTGRMLQTNIPLIRDFFNNRRSPTRLAAMIGLPIILGYLSGRVRLAQIEARLSQLTGGPTRAVEVGSAALAFDIDKPADLEYAARHLKFRE
jgi:hypothetical protein